MHDPGGGGKSDKKRALLEEKLAHLLCGTGSWRKVKGRTFLQGLIVFSCGPDGDALWTTARRRKRGWRRRRRRGDGGFLFFCKLNKKMFCKKN